MNGDESHAGGGPMTIVAAGNQPIPPQPTIPVNRYAQRSTDTPASATTRHNRHDI